MRIVLAGAVQGVGFRPFVYRLANELALRGFVRNDCGGLHVEVEGSRDFVQRFGERLRGEAPPAAFIVAEERTWIEARNDESFRIEHSDSGGALDVAVLPDLAICDECLQEIRDAQARRHGYAFTNCTRCGPRYTIIDELPYDRPRTAMRDFAMCDACQCEYDTPDDRRFHAQPIACPACGPQLSFVDGQSRDLEGAAQPKEASAAEPSGSSAAELDTSTQILDAATDALSRGAIVALKGIGGYQLLCDATNNDAVARLRERKHREAKPLAVMMPTLERARHYAHIDDVEATLLQSSAAPIVLLSARDDAALAPTVTQSSPWLGVMLPYSPLHHLLLERVARPLVCTSGNLSDEPMAIATADAHTRLAHVADCFVDHNRPILRAVDDSLARVVHGREMLLRRARGYAPLPIPVERTMPRILAVGAHLKNTVALAVGRQIVVSQHIGDLDTPAARDAFERTIADLSRLYRFTPDLIVCDAHPDYYSTAWARAQRAECIAVQHHVAHVYACAADNAHAGPFVGVSWDGTGYGDDATIWGGEIFLCDGAHVERIASLRPFALPGGERAVKQSWRIAASLLHGAGLVLNEPYNAVEPLLRTGAQCVTTSSMGRLFDGVAALTALCRENRYEGESGLMLEAAAWRHHDAVAPYPLPCPAFEADWRSMIAAIAEDVQRNVAIERIAARFHAALVEWIVTVARRAGVRHVALSGGCFQNAWLTERAITRLTESGFTPLTHQRTPPNDGAIALGQAVHATLVTTARASGR